MAPTEVSVNHSQLDDRTPLMRAISRNDIPAIIELLRSGTDPNATWTARIEFNSRRAIKGTPLSRYPIELACGSARLPVIKCLLAHGALLGPTNALHSAAAWLGGPEEEPARAEIIEFLIAQGCDVNKLEYAGEEEFTKQYWPRAYGTPLHYAASWGSDQIVECLLRNCADKSLQAKNYKEGIECGTPLDWAETNEPDEGMYSRRVLALLRDGEEKL